MNEAHKRFLTNGSNALEADFEEFDVYGKPQFHTMTSAKSERAIIIDFDDVAQGRPVDPVWRDEVEHVSHGATSLCLVVA